MPLEAELIERFGLRGAVVVGDHVDEDAQRASIGRATADLLDRTLTSDETVAVGMGRNVRGVAQQSRAVRSRGGTVVSAIGGSALFAEGLNSNEIASLLAESLGAKAEGLYAPAYAETAEVRGVFLRHEDVARTLDHARHAHVAIVGIGDADAGSLVVRMGAISVGDMTRMRRDGAVGDILGAFFDVDGAPSAEYIQERVVGILRDDLARIPHVIAVVSEASKTASTLGALRSGLVHTLVTTARLAQTVLAAE
jgi:DNA-binding transcriptional regulator LsrR (DeoR family)